MDPWVIVQNTGIWVTWLKELHVGAMWFAIMEILLATIHQELLVRLDLTPTDIVQVIIFVLHGEIK